MVKQFKDYIDGLKETGLREALTKLYVEERKNHDAMWAWTQAKKKFEKDHGQICPILPNDDVFYWKDWQGNPTFLGISKGAELIKSLTDCEAAIAIMKAMARRDDIHCDLYAPHAEAEDLPEPLRHFSKHYFLYVSETKARLVLG